MPEPGSPIAAVEGVTQRFGDVVALNDFALEVRAGEVLGLIGPNGAGKTTALRILTGLLTPTEGRVTVDGKDLAANPVEARRSFSFVPDGAPLYANLSPRQHLLLVGRLHGMDDSGLETEALRLLESLDLGPRADDPVGGFSRGMRQKTALACAILPRPPLLILDEPLSGLDAPTAAATKAILRAWADRGGAVLYTSHLLDVVERVCDRIAVIQRGELVAAGSLDELRARSSEGTLEQVFGELTDAEDPGVAARRVLG
ncbi:MAG: ABC transporter ATP-binding protein [Planctomycetota bacterium]